MLGKSLGVVSLDHIAFLKRPISKTWYSFLLVFDKSIWFLLFGIMSLIAFLLKFDKIDDSETNSFKKQSWKSKAWILTRTLLELPYSSFKLTQTATQLIFGFGTLVFFLKKFVGDEISSEMARPAGVRLFDSWNDLLHSEEAIFVLDLDVFEVVQPENTIKNYFDRNTDYYQDFTPRLKVRKISEANSGVFAKKLYKQMLKEKDFVVMLPKSLLDFGILSFYRESTAIDKNIVHVSKYGGEIQPYFLMDTHFSNDIKKEAHFFVLVSIIFCF